MRSLLPLLVGLALAASAIPAAAQAPVITERGDPSVRSDTVYALAVAPEDHPEDDVVLLLDDGVVRLEADGTGSHTYRTVAQLLTQEAAEGWGELTLGYDRKRERLRLNWVRVVDAATGEVLSDAPVHDQESLAPVPEASPVFTDRQIRRISLGGVAPGTIVDYSYTTETLEPVLPGDFLSSWSIHTGNPVRRSRYVLDVPAGFEPRIVEENLSFERRITRSGGRTVYDWSTAEVPTVEGEPFMATDSNTVYMAVTVGGRTEWSDIARWYAGLARDRYALTPEIEARAAEVVREARTQEDTLRALHRWIAQDFRYVSLSLGIGGYQPRPPAEVFATQSGDCKDKATLFVALASRMGARAYPVLLASEGGVDRKLPSIRQFDHAIAAVERPGGGYTFLDLTADLVPYGEVSPGYQGEFGLVVHPDGRGEEVTFPRAEPAANRSETRVAGELSEEGVFTGTFLTRGTGALQYGLRSMLSKQLTDRERRDFTRSLAQNLFDGAQGDSLEVFDGRDLRAEARIRFWTTGGQAARPAGGSLILGIPFANGSARELIAELEAREGPRRFDIDVESVIGPMERVSELRLTLPEGFRARLPENVVAESAFGRYSAEYAQEGRELRVVRTLSGLHGTRPAEELPELLRFLEEMSRDDAVFIVLERPGG